MLTVYYFGLDFVRFNFDNDFEAVYFESLFEGMSHNSDKKFQVPFCGKLFDIKYGDTRSAKFLYLEYFGDSVIHIQKVLDGGMVRSISYVVTFYSAFFYIEEIGDVLTEFIRRYREHMTVSRVDVALDTNLPTNFLWDTHRTQFKKKQVYEKDDRIETFYLGAKTNNKTHFIRVYDKKLDSQKKGKWHLFLPYLKQQTVTRIEVQYNILSCKNCGLDIDRIHDSFVMGRAQALYPTQSPLWIPFASCCRNSNGTFLAGLDAIDQGKAQTITFTKSKEKQIDDLDALPYARIMLGYAKRLQDQGFDVIEYLRPRLSPPSTPT
jgi:hypothetical protein